MTLTSKQRAELRAQAHHLDVGLHIGHKGTTDSLRQALDDMLRTKELVKVQWAKNVGVTPKTAANELAAQVGADVVQAIGRTATLFRVRREPARE